MLRDIRGLKLPTAFGYSAFEHKRLSWFCRNGWYACANKALYTKRIY